MNEPANDNHLPTWKLIEGEALAALRELPSNSVDAVITDPPYSSGGLHLSAR
jgi:site-specific DNA-methyltransferase (adenine-specific)